MCLSYATNHQLTESTIMKALTKLSLSTLFSIATMSASATEVNVNITDIDALQGTLYIQIFNSEKAFDGKGKATQSSKLKVTEEQHSVVFKDLENGTYAVKLFHDENENGKMDSNVLGIPKEGYGFSNNGGAFGPASFKDASFDVTEDKKIEIKLR